METLLQNGYTHSSDNPKSKNMETKIFKTLQNIQTKWINMFSSNNVILEEEFKTLLIKMAQDFYY